MSDAALTETIVIDRRFRGPPHSGNGGYTAGCLAALVEGPGARVMLKSPPPLNKELEVCRDGASVSLYDGETLVGIAESGSVASSAPNPISLSEATQASHRYVGFEGHLCPGCFVCGPDRDEGDGLRIFAGPTGSGDLVAAPWKPAMDLCNEDGVVRSEYIWSSLDCPTYFALPIVGDFVLLGSMTAEIKSLPRGRDDLTICAWPLGEDGRKHYSASALYDSSGMLLAQAECLWIALKQEQIQIYDEERGSA